MIGVHSTQIKKNYSEILETNALQAVNLIASEVLQPVAVIEPTQSFYVGTFTTPTDKYFYITSISLNAAGDGLSSGNSQVTLTDVYGIAKNISCRSGIDTSNSMYVSFAGRGFKCQKNTAVTFASVTSNDTAVVVGYFGSDRD